jgi:hypothetical protein
MEAQQNLVDVLTQAANGKMVTIEKSDEEIFHLRYIAFLLGNEYD